MHLTPHPAPPVAGGHTRFLRTVARLLLLSLLLTVLGARAAGDDDYRLAVGDSFQVFVLGEEDLSISATVNTAGTIFYPLLGELPVAGKTPVEVEQLLNDRLKGDYLVNPVVSVTMVSYRQFFLQGAVNNPGPHQYRPGLTLLKAILGAGGFSPLASESRIYVFGENETSKDQRREGPNYVVQPGDTIIVDESFF